MPLVKPPEAGEEVIAPSELVMVTIAAYVVAVLPWASLAVTV
jgi:hypothetical protein